MPVYSKDEIKGCCYYIITASRLLQHWTRNVELEFLLTTTESHEHENILPHIFYHLFLSLQCFYYVRPGFSHLIWVINVSIQITALTSPAHLPPSNKIRGESPQLAALSAIYASALADPVAPRFSGLVIHKVPCERQGLPLCAQTLSEGW